MCTNWVSASLKAEETDNPHSDWVIFSKSLFNIDVNSPMLNFCLGGWGVGGAFILFFSFLLIADLEPIMSPVLTTVNILLCVLQVFDPD